ncbi:lantibiotic dehydratase C-terminal domain-containing protein [Nonomuraea jiangxiensis]|nr:lantibiotic dehydratase C-terminal domain-containing protein [Nonomuraea jiangxiensis]
MEEPPEQVVRHAELMWRAARGEYEWSPAAPESAWQETIRTLHDTWVALDDAGRFDARRPLWADQAGTGRHPAVRVALDHCAHLFANRLGVPLDTEAALRRMAAAATTRLGRTA